MQVLGPVSKIILAHLKAGSSIHDPCDDTTTGICFQTVNQPGSAWDGINPYAEAKMNANHSRCVILADRHTALVEGIRGLLGTTFETIFVVGDTKSLLEGTLQLLPVLVILDLQMAGHIKAGRSLSAS